MKDAKAINYIQFPTENTSVFFPVFRPTNQSYYFTQHLTNAQLSKFKRTLKYLLQAPDIQNNIRNLYKDLIQEVLVFVLERKNIPAKELLAEIRRKYNLTANTVQVENAELLELQLHRDYSETVKQKQSHKTVNLYLPKSHLDYMDSLPINRSQFVRSVIKLYHNKQLQIDLSEKPRQYSEMKQASIRLDLQTYFIARMHDLNIAKLIRLFIDQLT